MELKKLDTNFINNTNLNYYKDIIRKVSDYDSNLKKKHELVNFSETEILDEFKTSLLLRFIGRSLGYLTKTITFM